MIRTRRFAPAPAALPRTVRAALGYGVCVLGASALSAIAQVPAPRTDDLRVGIIGCDTSHVIAFTKMLNDPADPDHIPGARVVAAFKGGSPDIESSASRVEGFAKDLAGKHGVEIVDSIEALLGKVDAVCLESVDGRPHLAQARPVFAAKKRLFIDKPMAGTLSDGREIARLSKESGTPFFSASSLRFSDAIRAVKGNPALGDVLGCEAYAPATLEPHHPDLFWYGVHGVEILYAFMGTGCESVQRTGTADMDVVVGKWKDGRIATFRGKRQGPHDYGALVHGTKGTLATGKPEAALYRNLVVEIVKFFRGGEPPVSADEMLEVLAFMEAADASKKEGGKAVPLDR